MSGEPFADVMVKHLWEVDHSYYCHESNYFSNDTSDHCESIEEFTTHYANSDMDMNLVFRWDWKEEDPFTGDVHFRNGVLKVFWMLQRKGIYRCTTVAVCRADEPKVIAFLKPRRQHLLSLWEPLASPSEPSE
jgi:hypothetical protein